MRAASASFLLSRFSLSATAVRSYIMRRALAPVALSFATALWTLAKLNVNGNAGKRISKLRGCESAPSLCFRHSISVPRCAKRHEQRRR